MAAICNGGLASGLQSRSGIAGIKGHPGVSGEFFDEHKPATQLFGVSVRLEVEHGKPDLVSNVADKTNNVFVGRASEVSLRHIGTDFLLSHRLMCPFDSELESLAQRLSTWWAIFR